MKSKCCNAEIYIRGGYGAACTKCKEYITTPPTSMEVEEIITKAVFAPIGENPTPIAEATQAITHLIQQARVEERAKFKELMHSIIDNDKTPAYDYPLGGKKKDVVNGQGQMPEGGQRWLTPTEMAKNYLRQAQLTEGRKS